MNQANIIVDLNPTAQELASAAAIGSLINLYYAVQGPCQILKVTLDSNSWILKEIAINRRYGLLGSYYWCAGIVLLPGHSVGVTIENTSWSPPMTPPDVTLELAYENYNEAFEKRPDDFPLALKPAKNPTPENVNARESFLKRIREERGTIRSDGWKEEELAEFRKIRDKYESDLAALEKAEERAPPPPPTRFSELDIEDDEPPSS